MAQDGPDSPETAMVLRTIGNLYQAKGDVRTAEIRLLKAFSILEKSGPSQQPKLVGCRQDLALLYARTRQYSKVTPQLREALNAAKDVHQHFFGTTGSETMKEAFLTIDVGAGMAIPVASYLVKRKPDSAMAIQQLSFDATLYLNGLLADESRALKSALRNRVQSSKDPGLQQLYKEWLAQKQDVLDAAADEQDNDLYETEEKLFRRSGLAQLPSSNAITWTQVRDSLKTNQAAVAFVRFTVVLPDQLPIAPPSFSKTEWQTDTLYAAMVIRPGYKYPRFVAVGREQQIRQLLATGRTPATIYGTSRGPGFDNITYGDSLYQLIWKPIEKLVQGANRIYFSAEGLLNRVAFSALPLPGTTASLPVTARYLSGRHELHQLFSTRQLAQGIRPFRIDGGTSAALMGGINYQPNASAKPINAGKATYLEAAIERNQPAPFEPLDSTREEVNAIRRIIPRSVLATERDASEKRFRQLSGNAPTILHLATHGFYLLPEPINKQEDSSDEPLMRSALALAGVNSLWETNHRQRSDEDGLLTAYEVADLDLSKTRLVVLSACESALGDLRGGADGVYGLQRAFRIAGAEKLIVSLWKVSDAWTKKLMELFYTNLKAGQEVREAFRNAQVAIQKQTPDPTLWAAFVLIE